MRLRDLGLNLNIDYHLVETKEEGQNETIILCHNKKEINSIKYRHPKMKIYFVPEITEDEQNH